MKNFLIQENYRYNSGAMVTTCIYMYMYAPLEYMLDRRFKLFQVKPKTIKLVLGAFPPSMKL